MYRFHFIFNFIDFLSNKQTSSIVFIEYINWIRSKPNGQMEFIRNTYAHTHTHAHQIRNIEIFIYLESKQTNFRNEISPFITSRLDKIQWLGNDERTGQNFHRETF